MLRIPHPATDQAFSLMWHGCHLLSQTWIPWRLSLCQPCSGAEAAVADGSKMLVGGYRAPDKGEQHQTYREAGLLLLVVTLAGSEQCEDWEVWFVRGIPLGLSPKIRTICRCLYCHLSPHISKLFPSSLPFSQPLLGGSGVTVFHWTNLDDFTLLSTYGALTPPSPAPSCFLFSFSTLLLWSEVRCWSYPVSLIIQESN